MTRQNFTSPRDAFSNVVHADDDRASVDANTKLNDILHKSLFSVRHLKLFDFEHGVGTSNVSIERSKIPQKHHVHSHYVAAMGLIF